MRYATAHLDELERLPSFGVDGVWRPVRHHFGIEGFGINAFTVNEPGTRVIELDPIVREWAAADEDFASLRGDAGFEALLGG
jgi:hypothetical protein